MVLYFTGQAPATAAMWQNALRKHSHRKWALLTRALRPK